MSTNPTNAKMMFVNCHVNLTPCTHFVQPLPPGAKSITCDFCNTTIHVLDHDPCSSQPPPHSPKKKAVICGISYQKSSLKLEGSMKDAKDMKDLLIEGSMKDAKDMKDLLIKHFNFSESDIFLLTEEQTHPFTTPTKDNLLRALRWLGQGCQPGDSLVFYYSGPGLRLRNYRLSEVDGCNETLCPMDFETRGMIFDDEINEVIVGHLPRGVKLHAIIDSCHRNSVLDLRFLYRKNRSTGQYEWENHSPPSGVFKGTSGGDAISFSGSVEVPTSADTPLISETTSTNTTSIVSMTSRFIKAIEDGHKAIKDGHKAIKAIKDGHKAIKDGHKQTLTYKSILDSMQSQNTINETVPNSGQEPLLSACGQFDVNSEFTL